MPLGKPNAGMLANGVWGSEVCLVRARTKQTSEQREYVHGKLAEMTETYCTYPDLVSLPPANGVPKLCLAKLSILNTLLGQNILE